MKLKISTENEKITTPYQTRAGAPVTLYFTDQNRLFCKSCPHVITWMFYTEDNVQ